MLTIVKLGDPLLRQQSKSIGDMNGEYKKLAEEMLSTMAAAKGLGLAAVQVGELVRLFVVKIPKATPRVFINPEILETSIEEVMYEEGCLSIPGINADVKRPEAVRIQAYNERGKLYTLSAEGLLSRVIQHEMDHLNGVLFLDRLNAQTRDRLLETYNERVRQ